MGDAYFSKAWWSSRTGAQKVGLGVLGAGAAGMVGAGGVLSSVGTRVVKTAYHLGTSRYFWLGMNIYQERGEIGSILRREPQTVSVRFSARPARLPMGLAYGPVRLYPQPYVDFGITPKGGHGGQKGDSSTPSGSGAPTKVSPDRTKPSSARSRGRSRRPRHCPRHRGFDWCWTKR